VGCDAFLSFADASSVVFQVYGNGILLYEGGIVRVHTPAQRVDVDMTEIGELRRVVTDAGDGSHWDHADWAEAKLLA